LQGTCEEDDLGSAQKRKKKKEKRKKHLNSFEVWIYIYKFCNLKLTFFLIKELFHSIHFVDDSHL